MYGRISGKKDKLKIRVKSRIWDIGSNDMKEHYDGTAHTETY